MKEFTREELSKYNGKNGQPAYVAMGGNVYDVSGSGMWGGGEHMGRHSAGMDLSEVFPNAPHDTEVFSRVNQVGVLARESSPVESPAPAKTEPVPAWAKLILSFHPHPIMVHFPQAAFTFAPLFLIAFYVKGTACLERAAYYTLILGVLSVLPAYITGLFHWIYKYAKAGGGVYYFKMIAGQALILLSVAAALIHTSAGVLDAGQINFKVVIVYLLLLPVAASLGHAGGIIVFGPRK